MSKKVKFLCRHHDVHMKRKGKGEKRLNHCILMVECITSHQSFFYLFGFFYFKMGEGVLFFECLPINRAGVGVLQFHCKAL